MIKVLKSPHEMMAWRGTVRPLSVGFVPTMGALHAGHVSLLKRARIENNVVVLSIFVNPTQFNDKRDFDKYPKTIESDLVIAEQNGVDVVITPSFEEMYPDSYRYKIIETEVSRTLCGASRPGHFDGVLSVVMKLLQLVTPDRAYFGEKDYQQLKLVSDMATAFFLPTTIVPCETVRENSGLAMSSRNERLSPDGRMKAAEIFRTITTCRSAKEAATRLTSLGFEVDYLEDIGDRRFVAAKLEDVRLIDNVKI